ncbi:hypothetical protein GE09DRAFT_1209903 [Coniochaeta sp. 2T2.1]|nr:hypothetical protein GE09DRAFT_1209903 [Coniochaeta sp. 2T2.1]
MSSVAGSSRGEGNRKRARAQGDVGGREGRRSATIGRSREADAAPDATAEPIEVGEIQVGSGTAMKKWQVHINRFSAMSPYLKVAFAHAFADQPGAVPTVKMPTEDPRIFQWIHDWIYAASFSGLDAAPVPVINGPGVIKKGDSAADEDDGSDDDDVIITAVKSTVQNQSDPLGIAKREEQAERDAPAVAAGGAQPIPDVQTPVKPESDVEEVSSTGTSITPRDLMELYLLAKKLEIYPLGNAAIDAIYVWFHPDAERRRRGPNSDASPIVIASSAEGANQQANNQTYERAKQLPFRRVPFLTDVAYVFSKTPEDNSLRRLLICTCVMYLVSPRPQGRKLPAEWQDVLTGTGEIGFAMIRFVGALGWTKGKDTKDIVVWPRHSFHEAAVNIKIDGE